MKRIIYWTLPAVLLLTFVACRKFFAYLGKDIRPKHGALLSANGPGDTYELIDSVLGRNAHEEVPDCSLPDFGRHIAEIYDSTLHRYVFVFYIHVHPDND